MAEAEAAAPEQSKKKGSPFLLIAIVGAIMVAEAVVVYVLVGFTAAPPASAAEVELLEGLLDDEERVMEIELIHGNYQNRSTGRTMLWETEVVLQVRKKHQPWVAAILEQRSAEIRESVAKIVGGATDRQLSEPGRQTVDRQVTKYVNELFGTDGNGEHRVVDVLIPTLNGNLADF